MYVYICICLKLCSSVYNSVLCCLFCSISKRRATADEDHVEWASPKVLLLLDECDHLVQQQQFQAMPLYSFMALFI